MVCAADFEANFLDNKKRQSSVIFESQRFVYISCILTFGDQIRGPLGPQIERASRL